ncbi:potassium channel family protein [Cyanobium sp. ATX 6F1]|uniref:potassium channel family protein n=1 Tax=Cyanobium sp. ATX 6F1 TaxID=2823702 RepID=UPI0020CE89B4|nr:TrkA family potassium uptake protein [Cyanobium sp. ATX 6F1]MCP9917406.1 TrkA family potassium uptake protein [Cyanobium sp. ATX 6F1]
MSGWWQWAGSDAPLENSFAVIGVGRFGSAVCKELAAAGAPVLAIDMNQRAIDELRQLDPAIEARVVDCTDEEALRAAGLFELSTVVVAISEPIEVSITATLIAKDSADSRVNQVIARASSDLHEKMLLRVGADKVVFPSRMQGARLGRELIRPNLLERLRLDDTNSIEEIRVPKAFIGRSLREINLRKSYGVSVLAAGRAERLLVNPPASLTLNEGELLVVMGPTEALESLPSS